MCSLHDGWMESAAAACGELSYDCWLKQVAYPTLWDSLLVASGPADRGNQTAKQERIRLAKILLSSCLAGYVNLTASFNPS
jgi:hypothetical protein